jgi:hypothetical protein
MTFPAIRSVLLSVLTTGALTGALSAEETTLSLKGEWAFQLDGEGVGIAENWQTRELKDSIQLPGTTDENQKGIPQDEKPTDRLARPWYWKGPAWYQREVTIPEAWQGKRITLFLERTKNTRVWVDQEFCGWDDTLSAPQIYDLTGLVKPGKHTITLLIDNSKLPPVGPSHAVDERTQTNWNGVVGDLELRASDPVWIEDAQIYPDVAAHKARIKVVIGNITGKSASGHLEARSKSYNTDEPMEFKIQSVEVNAAGNSTTVEWVYDYQGGAPLWDEFTPTMLSMHLSLSTRAGEHDHADETTVSFGMRDFTAERNQLLVNGKPIFLRGRLDCANYPLTGYAPMDKAEWLRILGILKEWGLNHVRFHSWCPPRAAFEAADELGVYLQPEFPNKRSAFKAPENEDAAVHNIDRLDVDTTETQVELYDYAKREAGLIFRNFGNHPSFVMFTLGNELGRTAGMFELVGHFKDTEPRVLHAQGSNNMHWNPSLAEGDQFWVTGKVETDAKPLRGSFSLYDFPNAPIEAFPPSTLDDFSGSIEGVPVPLIGHETGQFQVAPDFRDIPKFTGVLKARNYEIFRERLREAGMLDQAHDFVRASGALSAICYREDIELALRTPGFGGFQLLDIMDFPGQGTALVGMLNVFMESKGVIEPSEWREFCAATVPLLRMEKFTWTKGETFTGRIQVAHYGPADMVKPTVECELLGIPGGTISKTFSPEVIGQGGVADIGTFSLRLNHEDLAYSVPRRVILKITIKGTPYTNSYPLWIYRDDVDITPANGVIISHNPSDEKTSAHLKDGGKVLLLPKLDKLPHSVPGGFQTEFWSPMFAQSAIKRGVDPPPGTLGIFCDPQHPALARFPTEFHTNWQWWHLVKNSRPIIFDDAPDDFRPIVQVIDNFITNHKLGLLAETRVGKGLMLICPIDLTNHLDQPAVRQFQHSILHYMNSPDFAPESELDPALLKKLLPN